MFPDVTGCYTMSLAALKKREELGSAGNQSQKEKTEEGFPTSVFLRLLRTLLDDGPVIVRGLSSRR